MDRFDRRDRESGVAFDILRGAVAGLVATWVMDRVDWFMYRREPEASRRRTWEVRPRHMDPAHAMAAEATEAAGVALSSKQLDTAGLAVHYAIGVAPAAIYGALRGRVPGVDAGAGLAYGLAMFALEDEIANPAFGFAAPPGRYPWQPHARGLVAHLVYGVVTEMLLRAMAPRSRRRRGRPAT